MTYTACSLDKLKDIEMEIFNNFKQVCKKYDIQYFAIFGTLIGAMRHKDFIPWDDDIDVGIFRDDFEKLKNVPTEEWGQDFLVLPSDNDKPFHRVCFPKLYRKGTIFAGCGEVDLVNSNNRQLSPIWMDIFLFDRVSSFEFTKKTDKKKIRLRKLYRVCKTDLITTYKGSIKKTIYLHYRRIIHNVTCLITSPKKIYARYTSLSDNNGEYVTTFDSMERGDAMLLFCKYDDMFPFKEVDFRNTTISVPNNVEELLTNMYGNYMELPPENKRINHCPVILDFGDGINVMENK